MSIPAPFGRTLATAGCLLALGGCAATTPSPRFSAVSPADPAAAESAVPAPAAMLTGAGELAEKDTAATFGPATPAATAPAATPPTGHEHHGATADATTYTCPLHPEIAAQEPGKCPFCGMTLVKKAAAPKEQP